MGYLDPPEVYEWDGCQDMVAERMEAEDFVNGLWEAQRKAINARWDNPERRSEPWPRAPCYQCPFKHRCSDGTATLRGIIEEHLLAEAEAAEIEPDPIQIGETPYGEPIWGDPRGF